MRTITVFYYAHQNPSEDLVKALADSDHALKVFPSYEDLLNACTGNPTTFVIVDLRGADEATLEAFGTELDPLAAKMGMNILLIVDDDWDTILADQHDLRALLAADATPEAVLDALTDMVEDTLPCG